MSSWFTPLRRKEFEEDIIMAAVMQSRSAEVGHRRREDTLQIMGTVTQKQGIALVLRVCK